MPKKIIKPLDGIRVLSIETQVAGPYCTMMLGDAGAEVIKIESPGRGDASREPGPILKDDKGGTISGYFMRWNRNKKSLTLNLKNEEGRKIFSELLIKSDVILENLKPGFLTSIGFSYETIKEINPKIIHVSISGFGVDKRYLGPFTKRTAYDIVIQAMGGLMDLIGYEDGPPLHPMIAFGDVVTGMMTAYAVMLALYKRQITGKGDSIDMAMYDVMLSLTERTLNFYSMTGKIMSRGKESLIYPWGSFKTKDGYVALIVLESKMWKRFCEAIQKPELFEDERFKTASLRSKYKLELEPIINEWMKDKTSETICDIMLKNNVPIGEVNNAEQIFNSPQAKARKMWMEIDDPVASKIKVIGNPVKMSSIPVDEKAKTVPRLGEHTDEILKDILEISSEEINELKTKHIV